MHKLSNKLAMKAYVDVPIDGPHSHPHWTHVPQSWSETFFYNIDVILLIYTIKYTL